jgi:hypothetical protein
VHLELLLRSRVEPEVRLVCVVGGGEYQLDLRGLGNEGRGGLDLATEVARGLLAVVGG